MVVHDCICLQQRLTAKTFWLLLLVASKYQYRMLSGNLVETLRLVGIHSTRRTPVTVLLDSFSFHNKNFGAFIFILFLTFIDIF